MSLHFLLDAYNIIYQIPTLAKGSLEEQRKRLIEFIDIKRPQGSYNNLVTIVFDGRPDFYGREPSKGAKIVYASHETADEKILRLVDSAANRKNIIVVTDDRSLQYAVRALGAKVLSVREFIEKGDVKIVPKRGISQKSSPKKESPKEISQSLEFKITSEMESIWLKDKKGKKG